MKIFGATVIHLRNLKMSVASLVQYLYMYKTYNETDDVLNVLSKPFVLNILNASQCMNVVQKKFKRSIEQLSVLPTQ